MSMPHRSKIIAADFGLLVASAIGKGGANPADLSLLKPRLAAAYNAVVTQRAANKVGFLTIPDRHKEIRQAEALARDVARKCKTLIVIGIGGSDLGARAIISALAKKGKGMDVRFIGANTDPEEIAALLGEVDLKKTALNIISKSGDTIEPMSTFLLLRDRLIKKVGVTKHADHVIATTDGATGTLREIVDLEAYRTLPVPRDIGGRFSALTPVGLFPAACAGISGKKLVDGAREVLDGFFTSGMDDNAPLMYAAHHFDAYARRAQSVTVLMPYSAALKEFAFWFRQLWAESLGKRLDRTGDAMHHGFTPVAALGATDQHSQLQLYNEGPADKMITFIEVETFRADFAVPKPYAHIEGVDYMAGRKFSEIIHAERKATALALAKNGRPSCTLTIPAVTPESVGGLMMFFMLATAVMGELLNVNAYDQPGVEEGKRMMYALLGRKGY